jgi:hypothetical protein
MYAESKIVNRSKKALQAANVTGIKLIIKSSLTERDRALQTFGFFNKIEKTNPEISMLSFFLSSVIYNMFHKIH